MKRLIVTLGCCLFLLNIFLNMDKITDLLLPFIEQNTKVVPQKISNYKKNDNFLFVQNVTNFSPLSKRDIQNIFYTIVNNGWNNFSFYCPKEYTNCLADVKDISQNQELLTHINNFVHPYNGFKNMQTVIHETGEITVNITYFYNDDYIKAINKKVDSIYKEIIKDDMSPREKIKVIHDYIINHTKYDVERNDTMISNYQSYLAYGLLFEGYATCNGYTDTMALFLDKMGIPNFKVATTYQDADKEGHVWNALYIDNTWLHLDLTWDDPVSEDGKDYLLDTYFLINTSQLEEIDKKGTNPITDHTFKKNIYLELKNNS